jgi:hypothetical protein
MAVEPRQQLLHYRLIEIGPRYNAADMASGKFDGPRTGAPVAK